MVPYLPRLYVLFEELVQDAESTAGAASAADAAWVLTCTRVSPVSVFVSVTRSCLIPFDKTTSRMIRRLPTTSVSVVRVSNVVGGAPNRTLMPGPPKAPMPKMPKPEPSCSEKN